jgi:Domain of unknown function (DUF4397)
MPFVRSTALLLTTLVLLLGGVAPARTYAVNVTAKVLNASPDTGAIDVYDNQTLIAANIGYRAFSLNFQLSEGVHLFRVFPTGANITTTPAIVQFNVSLSPGYSYVIGIANNRAQLTPMVITDPTVPRSGYFRFRMVNLSPATPSVDLINSSGRVQIDDVVFGNAKYITLRSGAGRYHFQVRRHGTNDVLIDLPSKTYASRSRQTLWLFNANIGTRSFSVNELANEQFILSTD